MTGIPAPRRPGKAHRIVIKCKQETLVRWRVNVADSMMDGESYINELMNSYRTMHPGTGRPIPGKTFGQILGGGQR